MSGMTSVLGLSSHLASKVETKINCTSCDPAGTQKFNASQVKMNRQLDAGIKGINGFVKSLVPSLDAWHGVGPAGHFAVSGLGAIKNTGASLDFLPDAVIQPLQVKANELVATVKSTTSFYQDPSAHVRQKAEGVVAALDRLPDQLMNLKNSSPEIKGAALGTVVGMFLNRKAPRDLFHDLDRPPPLTVFTANQTYKAESQIATVKIDTGRHAEFENKTVYAKYSAYQPNTIAFWVHRGDPSAAHSKGTHLENIIVVEGRGLDPKTSFVNADGSFQRLSDSQLATQHIAAKKIIDITDLAYGWRPPIYRTKTEYAGVPFNLVPVEQIHFLGQAQHSLKNFSPDPLLAETLARRGFDVTHAPTGVTKGEAIWLPAESRNLVGTAASLGMESIPVNLK